jgi:hypothetical protein
MWEKMLMVWDYKLNLFANLMLLQNQPSNLFQNDIKLVA